MRDLSSRYTRLLMLSPVLASEGKTVLNKKLATTSLKPENVVVQRRAVAGGSVETAQQATAGHVDEQIARILAAPEYLAAHDVMEIVSVGFEFALRTSVKRE